MNPGEIQLNWATEKLRQSQQHGVLLNSHKDPSMQIQYCAKPIKLACGRKRKKPFTNHLMHAYDQSHKRPHNLPVRGALQPPSHQGKVPPGDR